PPFGQPQHSRAAEHLMKAPITIAIAHGANHQCHASDLKGDQHGLEEKSLGDFVGSRLKEPHQEQTGDASESCPDERSEQGFSQAGRITPRNAANSEAKTMLARGSAPESLEQREVDDPEYDVCPHVELVKRYELGPCLAGKAKIKPQDGKGGPE